MSNAYATIASGGYRNRPRVIKKITRDGKPVKLPKRWRVHRVKAFEDGVTYEATKILEQNVAGGTGGHAQIGCTQGGKTGTTDKNIDAWFVGITPRFATAVWVGFPGSAAVSMNGMYRPTGGNIDGGTYPADIWGDYMRRVVGKTCKSQFKQPTQPFHSQPFFGHYSREGLSQEEDKDPSSDSTNDPQQAAPQEPTKPSDPGKQNNGGNQDTGKQGNNDAAFDPGAYETKPQGPPATQDPSGGTQAPPTDG
jgi:penicillin-binding protein 1A